MPTDEAVLMTVVTALLIRAGGHVTMTPVEWEQAINHESTLWVSRDALDQPIKISLLPKEVEA